MNTLPKIKLNKTEMTDTEFRQELEKSESTGTRRITPGNYDVKVTGVEHKGPAANDPTWHKFKVLMADASGATIQDLMLVPTVTLRYASAKGAMFPARKLTEFFAALGEDFVSSSSTELLNRYFIANGVVGKTLNIDAGYKANYVKYLAKDSYAIVDRDGRPYKDEKGEPLPIFNGYKEAEEYATTLNLKIDKFIGILKYNPSEATSNDNEGDDLPF